MDMNTVLMDTITNMSEYFVVANTRTSFTDLAESSVSLQTNAAPNQHQSNLNQQFANSSPGLSKTSGGASNQQQMSQIQHQQQQQHHASNNDSSSNLHSPSSCNQNQNHYHNHSYSANHANNSSSSSMQTTTRLSQPVRTQIPIHCYIEQLDACAEMSGFSSPLNDSDLFNTTNTTNNKLSLSPQKNNQHNHNHSHHHPHLHQSKLALESVTNCNGSASLASLANSSCLFNENDTNNNDNNDLYSVDNLEHLNSNSPLSIHQQTTTPSSTDNNQTNSICGSTIRQASSSYDNHNFQSCRETYAIVTSNVLYIDLVRTVLLQLGYSAMDLINAKATIQIKNWRPLALDQVTEDKTATVGEVLGDISTFVTLRIRLYSSVTQLPTEWTETMIRQVVLALTQTMSQLTLSKLCNISQPLISSIVRGGKKLGRRKCSEFGQWYMNYIKSAEARPSTMFCEGGGARLVFDKSREIPQLKDWFSNNTKPSDELLEEYSKILNDHALRKDRPQVTAKALKNWWKNERQKLGIRQREIRGRPKMKRID